MAATLVDILGVLLLPLILSAAAWVIAIKALAEKDAISKVVDTLTQPIGTRLIGIEATAKREDVPLRRSTSNVIASPDAGWFQMSPSRSRHSAANALPAAMPAKGRALPAALRTALIVILAAELTATAAPPAHAGRFEFDSRRTEVRFVYKMAYSKQRGRFTKVNGTLDYDDAAPEKAKISASIATASLTTGEALVDNELKGSSFFNVVASPVIAFKSLSVKSRSATAADVAGEITVNGITKPVTLKVSLKPHVDPALKHDAGAREFIATTRIQRSAFNMTDYQSMVDDDIEIEIAAIVRPR